MKKEARDNTGQRLYITIILFLLAVVSLTAATAAWFTIADHSKVQSMGLDIYSGASLRFDLVPHDTLEEYTKTLEFEEIASYVLQHEGTDWKNNPLEPVTTKNCTVFTSEKGKRIDAKSGSYLEFTLHFMAAEDMVVHLTSENSKDKEDGTRVLSDSGGLVEAMRISFTSEQGTSVYDPGDGEDPLDGINTFTLPSADKMVYNDSNALFSLKAYQNLPVKVRVWLEGTDKACTDELRGTEYSIRLRFEGTDEDNNRLDGTYMRNTEETEQQ